MRILIYSAKKYEIPYLKNANQLHLLKFVPDTLDEKSAHLAKDYDVVCCFVLDKLNSTVLQILKQAGIRLIALRCTGYDNVDLNTAKKLGLTITRVPNYSPNAVAEFAIGLILALDRKIIRANDRIRQHNFSLEGQVGFNLQDKVIGIIGTGNIGTIFAKIINGFDCKILAYDPKPNSLCNELGITYTSKEKIFQQADIISLHCPLNKETQHIIDKHALSLMKIGVMLINTGRGALIDTKALIQALKDGKIGALGLDVYEHENQIFFQDHSDKVIQDDDFIRLQSFPNVLITGHQAYLSKEALSSIAETVINTITCFAQDKHIESKFLL